MREMNFCWTFVCVYLKQPISLPTISICYIGCGMGNQYRIYCDYFPLIFICHLIRNLIGLGYQGLKHIFVMVVPLCLMTTHPILNKGCLQISFECFVWSTRPSGACLKIKMSSYHYRHSHVKDYENPLHLDVVDRYLRWMGDKTIPGEAPSSLESLYPPWVAGVNLPQARCCGFFVLFTNKHNKVVFQGWNTGTSAFRRLSHSRQPYNEVALNCMRRYGDVVTFICYAK